MHRLLQRILKKNGLNDRQPPSKEQWAKLLSELDGVFDANDEDRYLLERSLDLSSQEMNELMETSKKSYQQRITALISVIPDLIFYVDEDGTYLDVLADGKESQLYVPKEQIIGKKIHDIFPPKYADMFFQATAEAIRENRLKIINYTMHVEGEKHFYEARIMPTNLTEHGRRTTTTIVRDITQEKKSREYLDVIKKIFEEATEGILISSYDAHYFEINDAFCRMLGISSAQIPGRKLNDYRKFFDKETAKKVMQAIETDGCFHGEVSILRHDGTKLFAWMSIDTVYDENQTPAYLVVMLTDISELHASKEKLHFAAMHDTLTRLPNRTALFERLNAAIERAKRNREKGALFFIDLDHFKEINDSAGHDRGDKVLITCARRLQNALRHSDTVGRFGGDEFLVILEKIKDSDTAMQLAQKLISLINEPCNIGNDRYELGASIGIAIFPDDGIDAEHLIRYADLAMYRAKIEGRNRFHYYSEKLNQDIQRRNTIERALKDALRNDRFHLLYQPFFDLQTHRISGFEALLRIDDPEVSSLSPAEFIPIAEESDLILHIGRWVLETCCRQIVAWKSAGIRPPRVSINLSRRQLTDTQWPHYVMQTLERYGVEASQIEFEITETTFMHAKSTGSETIDILQKAGLSFSIDDFGTNCSSLVSLRHFPLDKLKIDRSFIANIERDTSDLAIVKASIALAKALGLSPIAEGVETQKQQEILQELHCDNVQGYFLSMPLPPESVPALIERYNGPDRAP